MKIDTLGVQAFIAVADHLVRLNMTRAGRIVASGGPELALEPVGLAQGLLQLVPEVRDHARI